MTFVDVHHRHVSQLYGLYPGNLIHREDEELLVACRVALDRRGPFITESLQKKASAIIAELPTQFSTRLFIWKLADEHEHDYIEMLIAATKTEKTRSFHSLHAQIGTYLLDHSDELGIIKLDIREKNVNPFGRITESQLWEKL